MKKRSLHLVALTVLVCLFSALFPAARAGAQTGVRFTDQETQNQFPDQLVFRARATSSGSEIIQAEFAYTSENYYSPESYTREEVAVTPGMEILLAYTLDTRDFTTPPLMAYSYQWELELADGSKVVSEASTIRYNDTRFAWQVLENGAIAVWWHDRPDEFGQAIFEIAAAAVLNQQELFQASLRDQIQVVINNDPQEFASWHNLTHDWVGGETFTNYGITVQIVESSNPEDFWLSSVIPHEISHIFYNQVTYNPTVSKPVWLNEGLAQYNEFLTQEWVLAQVLEAASAGELIPLSALEDGFGSYDTGRVYLSYAEALSAVTYLVETYGNEGLSALLAEYQQGQPTERAFLAALGIGAREFELDWAEWLGAVNYQIPTPWPTLSFPPSPTFGQPAGLSTPDPSPDGQNGSNPLCPGSALIALLGLGWGAVRLPKPRSR